MNYNDYFSPRGMMISYVQCHLIGSSRKGHLEYANPDAIILSSDVVGGFLSELPFDRSKTRSVYGYVHFGTYADDGDTNVIVPTVGNVAHGDFLNWTFQVCFPPPEIAANMVRMWLRDGVEATFDIVHFQVQPMVGGAVLLPPGGP